ncbi:MAG TPA: glycine/sarcosine/betaine reductase component B subunit, partial [Bacillota bacterium]|nr:glycine/sarcosine/betaine reductase component B subunit [Bacillota bacterium]
MRLELGKIRIKDVQFGPGTCVRNGVLYVDRAEVERIVREDERIAGASVELAHPGEEIRIIPVKDVIEPRVKVAGPGGVFPGMVSRVDTVGEGRTHVLAGAAVVTTGKIVGFQEGIIDMT